MPDEERNGGGDPDESRAPDDRRERQNSDDRPEKGQNSGDRLEGQNSDDSPEEGQVDGESPREERPGGGAPETERPTEADEWTFGEGETESDATAAASEGSDEDERRRTGGVRSAEDDRGSESDRGDGGREPPATGAGGGTGIESAATSAGGAAKGADEAFCESCGEAVKKEAEICPHCGVSRRGSRSTGDVEKNPGLAALASLILPGAGEVYNGEFALGGVVFLVYVVLWSVWSGLLLLITVFTLGVGAILWVFWPLGFLMNLVSAYISYTRAERINAGEIQV